ncbi:MAG: hypothetical protein ACOYJB_09135 [Christensenellaceae bacterium]|jgi:hypothetical protein
MTEAEKEVLQVVLGFAEEKTLWENAMQYKEIEHNPEKMETKPYDYFKTFDLKQYDGLTQNEISERYEMFFKKYTTPKKRVYSCSPASFGFPARYQGLTAEHITAIDFANEKRCEVTCKIPTGFRQTVKFIVLKKKDGWLLDSVKTYCKSDDKWSNSLL